MLRTYILNQNPRRRCLLALLAGISATLALAPLYILPMLYIGFAILGLLAFSQTSPKRAFLEGWLFGIGYFGIGLYWITVAIWVDPKAPFWLLPIALPAVAALNALAIGLPLAAVTRLSGLWSRFLALVLLLAVGEWLRGLLFQFPWNNFAQSMGFANFLLQPLAVLGRDAYSLLVILSLMILPLALARKKAQIPTALAALAIPALFAVWGTLRLDQAPPPRHHFFANAGVRIVQPNIPQADKLDPTRVGDILTTLIDLSLQDIPAWVNHIIWPEVALNIDIERHPELQRDLAKILPPGGTLISGILRKDNLGWHNSVVAFLDDGRRTLLHDKVRLVPFGEYSPLPFLNAIAGVESSNFVAGSGLSDSSIGLLPPFSTLICYEAIFSGDVRPDHGNTTWLLNLTNDAWFGHTAGPYQHQAIARWRAIEEGMALVRVANTGISAIYDGYGRLLAEKDLGEQGTLNLRIPRPLKQPTFFSQHPDLIWIVLMLLLAGATAAAWILEERPKLRLEL